MRKENVPAYEQIMEQERNGQQKYGCALGQVYACI